MTSWLTSRGTRDQGRRAAGAGRAHRPHGQPRTLRGSRGARQGESLARLARRHRVYAARDRVRSLVRSSDAPALFRRRPSSRSRRINWATDSADELTRDAFVPIPLIIALAPVVWWFFRATWRELDIDAQRHRGALLASGGYDLRPARAVRDDRDHPDAAGVLRRARHLRPGRAPLARHPRDPFITTRGSTSPSTTSSTATPGGRFTPRRRATC